MQLFSHDRICAGARKWLVENCPPQCLLNLLKRERHLAHVVLGGGFRPNVDSLKNPAVRQRIFNELGTNTSLCDGLIHSYGECAHEAYMDRMLLLLGRDWFRAHWKKTGKLMRYFKAHFVVMCASFSDTEDAEKEFFNRFGKRLLRMEGFWKSITGNLDASSEDKETVAPETKEIIKILEAATQCFQTNSEVEQQAEKGKDAKALSDSYREKLEKELTLNRELKDKLSDAEKKAEAAQKERNALRKEYGAFKHEQEGRMQRIQDDYASKLVAQYEEMQHDFLDLDTKWLKTSTLESDEAENLLERTKQVLEQQRNLNIKYGVRSELREKEAKLRDAYLRLATAAKESIHPHDELRSLMEAVKRKQQKIKNLLDSGDETMGSELYEYILTTIRSLKHSNEIPAELEKIRQYILDSESMELLEAEERVNLLDQCDKRHKLWQNMSRTGEDRGKQREPGFIPEIMDLSRHLTKASNYVLVIDGYNVLKRSDSWTTFQQRRGLTFAELRYEFVSRCSQKAHFFKSVRLVFDGDDPDGDDVRTKGNCHTVFAQRLDDEHNADRYIKEYVKEAKLSGEMVWLCTEDYGIRHDLPEVEAFVSNLALNRLLWM